MRSGPRVPPSFQAALVDGAPAHVGPAGVLHGPAAQVKVPGASSSISSCPVGVGGAAPVSRQC
eukprot:8691312-Alexandrium_andersonii.AAC.1